MSLKNLVSTLLPLSLSLFILSNCVAKNRGSETKSDDTPTLTGTWARQAINTTESSALGIKSKTKVTRYSLLQLSATATGADVLEKTCDFVVENTGSSSLVFPPAFIKSVPDARYAYTLVSSASGAKLVLKDRVEIFGAKLGQALTEELPSMASDPRVYDQDQDGFPGFSVDVSAKAIITISGKMYLVQRQVSNEELTLVDADTAKGPLVWMQQQKTLGSSNGLLTTVTPTVTPLLDQSSVMLKRLPEGSSCESLLAQRAQLF